MPLATQRATLFATVLALASGCTAETEAEITTAWLGESWEVCQSLATEFDFNGKAGFYTIQFDPDVDPLYVLGHMPGDGLARSDVALVLMVPFDADPLGRLTGRRPEALWANGRGVLNQAKWGYCPFNYDRRAVGVVLPDRVGRGWLELGLANDDTALVSTSLLVAEATRLELELVDGDVVEAVLFDDEGNRLYAADFVWDLVVSGLQDHHTDGNVAFISTIGNPQTTLTVGASRGSLTASIDLVRDSSPVSGGWRLR